MASPFADPRTGQLYFRRAVPEALRSAFEGKAVVKVSLRTKDPAEAKIGFARENAEFETRLAEARRRFAEGTLVPTPGALVRRWCEAPATGTGLSGPQRLVMTFMELDAAAGSRKSIGVDDPFPPAIMGPPSNTDWDLVCGDKARLERLVADSYGGDVEQTGTNWIRLRWHHDEPLWRPCLTGPAARLRAFDPGAAHFSEDEIVKALLNVVDERRNADEEANRIRLSRHRPRVPNSRRRPNLRLKTLFHEWKAGNEPRPQTAGEYEAAIDDFIDFADDPTVSMIDADMLYDYRDEAAKLPASMPRADRALPFTARVAKHRDATPKCAPPTLKKRVGALQALLTYAFHQRWTPANIGSGIKIVGYTKKRRTRRSFEDHELATLCASPLFVDAPQPGFDHWVSFKGQGTYLPSADGLNVDGRHVRQKGYITDELTDYALDWIGKRDGNRPWMMHLAHKAVHSEFIPADRHKGRYDKETFRYPENMKPGMPGRPMWVENQRNSWHGVDYAYHGNLDIADYYKRYMETLLAVDEGLARILKLLEQRGELDDTLILYLGDNGFMFG